MTTTGPILPTTPAPLFSTLYPKSSEIMHTRNPFHRGTRKRFVNAIHREILEFTDFSLRKP
jgi:hypothetical protein